MPTSGRNNERSLDPLTAQPPHLEVHIRWSVSVCAGGQPVASLALAEPRRISRAKRPACRIAEAASGRKLQKI